MFNRVLALRLALSAVLLFSMDVPLHIAQAHHCPGEPERPAKPNHSCRTRTQTIQEGEPRTTHPGGNPGRGSEGQELQDAECIAPVDPQVLEALRNERNEALRTMAGMGYAADRILAAMGKLIAARLQHLTEPNEGIAVRASRAASDAAAKAPPAVVEAGKAIAAYLTNDNAANHRYLYGRAIAAINGAEQALKQATRNPHVTLATIADELLIGKATGIGGAACRWGSGQAAEFANKVGEARKAKQTVACMNTNAKELAEFQRGIQTQTGAQPRPQSSGPPPVGPPPMTRLPQPLSSGIPPTCYQNQCWLNVQAVDHYWKTGQWIEPRPRGYPLIEELSDLPSLDPLHIKRDLKAKHGGDKAVDPGHGSCGLQAHAEGVPVPSSKQQIEQAIEPGRQGYVFVDWEQTIGNKVVKGQHVVNVRGLRDGTVEFFDRTTVSDANLRGAVEPQLWASAKRVRYFRSW
jgi:hypothetical protein